MFRLILSLPTLFFFLLRIPCIVFALLFSLPPNRNSDPGSHSRLFPPLPTTVRALRLAFQSFLPSSTRVELCLPTLGALSSSSFKTNVFSQIYSKSYPGGIRTAGPTLVALEGMITTRALHDRGDFELVQYSTLSPSTLSSKRSSSGTDNRFLLKAGYVLDA